MLAVQPHYHDPVANTKPSKSQLLSERKLSLKVQLTNLQYGFVERQVTLLSSMQTNLVRHGIDGAGRERARVRLLLPLNRTIRSTLAAEQRSKPVMISRGEYVSRLIHMRDDAELHHVIPVSLMPVDEAPSENIGDQLAWWQEAAHRETNLVSVASAEHTLIHNYLFAQGLYSITAQQKAGRNFSDQPLIVTASIPIKPGSLWMGNKPLQLNS